MARINTNVSALIAQRNLNTSYSKLNSTLERLSTGLRVSRGKDDPAGLIVSERLRSEISAVNQAIKNTQRAGTIISTTEGALNEVAALLVSIQDKLVESANRGALSDDEIKANQLQVDSAIASITRIANSTTFAGRALLNGSLDYITSGVSVSEITALRVTGAQFGTRDYIPVDVNVTTSAQPAELFFTGPIGTQPVTVEVQGNRGATTLSFVPNASASTIITAVNAIRDATGVFATSAAGGGVRFYSDTMGSKQFVSVRPLPGSGAFATLDAAGNPDDRVNGRDAVATINGAQSTGEGNRLSLRTATLNVELDLASSFGLGQTRFAITEGGSLFQLGPQVNSNLQVGVGVQSVAASQLGNAEIGFLSQVVTGDRFSLINGRFQEASDIVSEAIKQVSVLRGRLGAFEKNTLDTNAAQLGITAENLSSAESVIRDADFAAETSQLTRNQVLVSAGTSVLGLANQTPQNVLRLLGG
ncbi:MAG: flagellin [Phycisphaerales bacterium]|nr:flagellin [Phycisphaerales bacterium]